MSTQTRTQNREDKKHFVKLIDTVVNYQKARNAIIKTHPIKGLFKSRVERANKIKTAYDKFRHEWAAYAAKHGQDPERFDLITKKWR